MAVAKDKNWFVYDLQALDRAWRDLTVGELIERIPRGDLLDAGLAEEARMLPKGVAQVRWLGAAYLGTFKSGKEALEIQVQQSKELVETLALLARAGARDRTLWEFYAARRFYDRWFSSLPGEMDVDYGLLTHFTYAGARFQERSFQGILYGPCKDKNLLQRNLIGGNVMEVPPIEEIGYHPAFQEALLGISEGYLRERITRAAIAEESWSLVQALQKSILFGREKKLSSYVTLDQELVIAPDLCFSDRQSLHRRTPPARAPWKS